MLHLVRIQDFILVRELSFELGEGLNVITGETGAGKTIIINAIKYGIGENLPKELFDFSKQQPSVELHFIEPNPQKLQWYDIDPEEEIFCQRITKHSGKTLAYINGIHVPLPLYKDFCRQFIQIHGQNDTEQLFSTHIQKKLFNRFFSDSLKSSIDKIEALRFQYIHLKRELNQLRSHEQQRERERDFLQYQIQEIDEAKLQTGEWESLLEQRERLTHRENIKAILQQAQQLFQSDQGLSSLHPPLSNIINQLETIKQYSSDLINLSDSLQTILTLLKESERDIQKCYDAISSEDTEQLLYSVLNRIDLIKNLQRKFGSSITEILETKESLLTQLSAMENEKVKTDTMDVELHQITLSLQQLCQETSRKRKELSETFVRKIEKELDDLSMAKVKMSIDIQQEETQETEDSIMIDNHYYKLFPDGFDRLQYLVSTNPGQPYLPISKIASGGELSRFMLALQSLIGRLENIHTFIFDEIDAGIGGITANQVGQKCRELSKDKQIICITHLPQIAVKAHHHFVIDKLVQENQTSILLNTVDGKERINEVTRMLGEPYSSASEQLAKSMLEQEIT